ncbi:MAG: hypothetical protein JWO87_2084 [Phycisphaerales bacterium]|nr:hypothetical protein [Phycisphaerales bacterium]
MLPEPIDNNRLSVTDVPDESADWQAISLFALTFNGYEANGSLENCAAIANERRNETLSDLRTCLFFEQRRWRHYGDEPDDKAMAYIRYLLEQIRGKLVSGRPGT